MTDREPSTGVPSPKIPKSSPSRLVIAYGCFGGAVLMLYLVAGIFGFSFDDEERDALPLGVRQAPGGYRSYHLWHSGYQGGK
jgi:hypothetical protein